MTLVVIGPVTQDLVVIGGDESCRVGGACYFQSFVLDEFYNDYMVIVNCSRPELVDVFPDSDKVKAFIKDDTHYFINNYPDKDNLDIRHQSSNFADIPILKSDLENILPAEIDGFILNPLNRHDFPAETVEYLKSFGVPIYMSTQGFLRVPDVEANEMYSLKLEDFHELSHILSGVNAIFLDESEKNIISDFADVDEKVITDGSRGSRVVLKDGEIKISVVECENVVDTTGCGDTFMAAYVSQRLKGKSPEESGNFASLIASKKIESFGPYNSGQ